MSADLSQGLFGRQLKKKKLTIKKKDTVVKNNTVVTTQN